MTTLRTRRPPPAWRRVTVTRLLPRSPRLVRCTLSGPELEGLDPGLPGASVRLLVPPPGGGEPELPSWTGNEFLAADGSRPPIRTLTPLGVRSGPEGIELDVEVVLHGDGPLSSWAAGARPGDHAAVSGTGRGYDVDPEAQAFVLAGDESALPAIGTLLPALPAGATVDVVVEVADPSARVELPSHPGLRVRWCDALTGEAPGSAIVAAVGEATITAHTRVWAAGEAAAMQRVRRHLFDERGLPRSVAVVRGYWKHGRAGNSDE